MENRSKLRIWATLIGSYTYSAKHFLLLFRAGWLPMIISCGILILVPYQAATSYWLPEFILLLVTLWCNCLFAISWHRVILLKDIQPKALRFGSSEVAYMSIILVSGALLGVPNAIGSLIESTTIGLIFEILAIIAISLMLLALTALLPAVSIGDWSMTVGRVWKLWRGNRWRLFVLLTLVSALTLSGTYLTIKGFSVSSRWMTSMLGVNYDNVSNYGQDFAMFMLSYSLPIPFCVVCVFFLVSGGVGVLSLSYAAIARKGLEVDPDYDPDPLFRARLAL